MTSSSASTSGATVAVTRGRRLSRGQVSASITILPQSAHSFDDSIATKPMTNSTYRGPCPVQRQDSGYESLMSNKSAANQSRKSSISSHPSRKSAQQAPLTNSRPTSKAQTSGFSAYPLQSRQSMPPTTLFQFPEPDIPEPSDLNAVQRRSLPPPTTHYWTSDHTRRLEYEAIDAARRGVRGWVKRNLVPDCMVPKDGGHLDFDDDTGSVRRYRLELDEGDTAHAKAEKERSKSWLWWGRRS